MADIDALWIHYINESFHCPSAYRQLAPLYLYHAPCTLSEKEQILLYVLVLPPENNQPLLYLYFFFILRVCCTIMQEKGPESNLIMPSGAPGGFRWDVPRHRELLCVVLAIAAAGPVPGGWSLLCTPYSPGTRLCALYTANLRSVCRLSSHIENPVAPNITAFLFEPCPAE